MSYTHQQSGLVLYPYLMMDSDYDNTDRAALTYEGRNVSIFKRVRSDVYYTNVIHVMSDSQRTSAMNGVPTMTAPTSARSVGGHLEGDLGVTVGVELGLAPGGPCLASLGRRESDY
jgi:iron complex outermembrane receptor protein